MRKINVDIVLLNIVSPIKLGIYQNNKLINIITKDEKISDMLSLVFEELLNKFNIKNIIYINSPGSFLSIKLSYIFLKTLSICNNINILAIDGFFFNNNSPIRGIMKKYFIKKDEKIILSDIDDVSKICEFKLPEIIQIEKFNINIKPIYISPAIY
jgi:hypothetical protein